MRSVIALLLLTPLPAAQEAADDPLYRELERIGWDTTAEGVVPGMAAARIREGRVAWTLCTGFADPEAEVLITPETVINIGSVSKSVAAWGLMTLVERGELDLDEAVNDRLERWLVPESRKFDVGEVTLRRLLSHTAGLSVGGVPDYRNGAEPPDLITALNGHPDSSSAVRLIATPGVSFIYSGGGYTVAQLLVEEVTDQDFAAYVRAAVFEPLGMKSAGFGWTDEVGPEAARAHDPSGAPTASPRFTAVAASGCSMNVTDLARFAIANMPAFRPDSDEEVLARATLELMHTPAENAPNYGLGFLVTDLDGIHLVAHTGGNLGSVAKIAFAPELGEGFVVMMNGCGRAGLQFRERVEGVWREHLLAEARSR